MDAMKLLFIFLKERFCQKHVGGIILKVFINGVAVEPRSLYFSERRLIITLPSQVQVRANDYVGIVISPAVGIELPRKAGQPLFRGGDFTGTAGEN